MDHLNNYVPIEPYVQIEPQYSWHMDAYIRGNAAGLRELAKALLAAADGDAATTETVFASDGEGYEIEVRRLERPNDYPEPFYTTLVERHLPQKD